MSPGEYEEEEDGDIFRGFALPTLSVGVILLRRLGLALRQYNLTLELLQLRLQLVQLAVRFLHDGRDIGQRLAVGRDLPQLLRAGLYLKFLQTREFSQEKNKFNRRLCRGNCSVRSVSVESPRISRGSRAFARIGSKLPIPLFEIAPLTPQMRRKIMHTCRDTMIRSIFHRESLDRDLFILQSETCRKGTDLDAVNIAWS